MKISLEEKDFLRKCLFSVFDPADPDLPDLDNLEDWYEGRDTLAYFFQNFRPSGDGLEDVFLECRMETKSPIDCDKRFAPLPETTPLVALTCTSLLETRSVLRGLS